MLRCLNLQLAPVRGFHTSAVAAAAKKAAPAAKKRTMVHGYKKTSAVKQKKSSGVGKFFHEYVTVQKLEKNAPVLVGVNALDANSPENSVVKYNELQMKKLIVSGSIKSDQFRELFEVPITLVTKDTTKMKEFVQKGRTSGSDNNRVCILGENGIGKTTLLAQTQSLIAEAGDSIIIPISYATHLTNGRNDFALDKDTQLYTQPMYLKSFLKKILTLNETLLKKIPLTQEITLESNTKNKTLVKLNEETQTLHDLAKTNASPRSRGKLLDAIIHELTTQTEVPVFFTVDNFSSLLANRRTEYRDYDNERLHVSKFQLASLIFDLTSGAKTFKKGGVLLVTSADDRPTKTLYGGLGLVEVDPYTNERNFDPELAAKLKSVQAHEMSKFNKENVTTLIKKFIDADVFKSGELEKHSFETLVNQKYILSGNGNPGELIKSIVMLN